MNIRKFIACCLVVIAIFSVTSMFVYADDSLDDVSLPTNTPYPQISLFSSRAISEDAVKESTEIYNNFLSADPELFYLTEAGIKDLSFWGSPTDEEFLYLKAKAAEITAGCESKSDKIYAVMKYMAQNICYDYDYLYQGKDVQEVNLDPYDVLRNESTICEGYARTTATLLQLSGVPCVFVDSPEHKWNMAYNGERWVLFDTTWIASGILEYGVLNKSDDLRLEWYDFSIEEANANINHLVELLPLTIFRGELTSFPQYTAKSDIEIPASVQYVATPLWDSSFPEEINTLTIPESVENIDEYCFYFSDIERIYYEGTKQEFGNIVIGKYNNGITKCTNIIYADNAAKPYIITQPANLITGVGETVSVSLTADCDNDNITYQWYKNDILSNAGGTLIKGAVSPEYTFVPSAEGKYYFYAEVISKDASVSGQREVRTASIPVFVEVFKETPAEIEQIGMSARYIKFEKSDEAYIEGSGEVLGAIYDDSKTIYISKDITHIPSLNNWNDLRQIIVEPGSKNFYIDEYGALIDKIRHRIVKFPFNSTGIDKYVMPDDVVSVAPYAFSMAKVKEITLSSGLEVIGECAFYNAYSIRKCFIPASVRQIANGAFLYTYSLSDIYFFGDVPEIGREAFGDDPSDLPTIHYIEGTDWYGPIWEDEHGNTYNAVAFDPDIIFSSSACGDSATWEVNNGVLRVSGKGDMWDCQYNGGFPWSAQSETITEIVVDDGITRIGDYCFGGLLNVSKVSLPDSLKSIGAYAFYNYCSLIRIDIPKNVDEIGYMAFAYSYSIESAYFYGDAPTKTDNTIFVGAPKDFTVYYINGKSGWKTPTWNGYKTSQFTSVSDEKVYITGSIKSYGESNEVTTVKLLKDGKEVDSVTVIGNNGTYTLSAPKGKYILEIRKANHAVCKYDITVDGDDVTQDAEMYLSGDANHDGKSDTNDVVAILRYVVGYAATNFYSEIADINEDGTVDTNDAVSILRKVVGYN